MKSALDAKSEQLYLVNNQLLHKYLVVFLGHKDLCIKIQTKHTNALLSLVRIFMNKSLHLTN